MPGFQILHKSTNGTYVFFVQSPDWLTAWDEVQIYDELTGRIVCTIKRGQWEDTLNVLIDELRRLNDRLEGKVNAPQTEPDP